MCLPLDTDRGSVGPRRSMSAPEDGRDVPRDSEAGAGDVDIRFGRRNRTDEQHGRTPNPPDGPVPQDQLWDPERRGQPLRRADHDGGGHVATAGPSCAHLSDTGLRSRSTRTTPSVIAPSSLVSRHLRGLTFIPPERLRAFYHPSQVKKLKKRLGITLEHSTDLLKESEFIEASGLSNVRIYRKKGLIKPIGYAASVGGGGGISAFYHPRQIGELRRRLGITVDSTSGLLSERAFAKALGVGQFSIWSYRKNNKLIPVGYAMSTGGAGLSAFYHPRQIKQLMKALKKRSRKGAKS